MQADVRVALAKGCLAGLGLALAWLVIGGLLFLVCRWLGVAPRVALATAIAGGPVLVSAVVLGGVIVRSRRPEAGHATTARDDA